MNKQSYQTEIEGVAQQIQDEYPDRESYYDICEDMARTYDRNDSIIKYLRGQKILNPYSKIAMDLLDELEKKGVKQ